MVDETRPDNNDQETMLRLALRDFDVTLSDGTVHHVTAHFHDAGAIPGHMSFVTIDLAGRQLTSCVFMFGVDQNVLVREVTTAEALKAFAKVKEIEDARTKMQKIDKQLDTTWAAIQTGRVSVN